PGVDGRTREAHGARRARVHLRGPPRIVAPVARARRSAPRLPRAGRRAAGVRRVARLHPRRAPALDGAPVLRLVGLPDHGLLRPPPPLWHAARLHVPLPPLPPAGGRGPSSPGPPR